MKTFLSVGIGDMVCVDSLLTHEERCDITEIYWGCRFGRDLIPLFEHNDGYPNVKHHHLIADKVGCALMGQLDHNAVNFWHFRPDFKRNYKVGLDAFGLNEDQVKPINAADIFQSNRQFTTSTFLDHAMTKDEIPFKEIGVMPGCPYIVVHYPTSSRPRGDIASITNEEWRSIAGFAAANGLEVIVITDTKIDYQLPTNWTALFRPSIRLIVALIKYSEYYVGCDSFCAILASKVHDKHHLFVKSHKVNIQQDILTNRWQQKYFAPHPPKDIAHFYMPQLCLDGY